LGPDETLSGLQRLNKNVKRVFALLENLLEWSRIQTNKIKPRPEELKMKEIADETLYLLKENAANKGIQLQNLVGDNISVFADKNMISSVLQNLISNSIKFTNANGKIEISCVPNGKHITVKVKDNGVGMSQENVAKLFKIEENVSTPGTDNEKGTGLGLILCKELIEKNNGRIWCESKPGDGSEFYFSLPLWETEIYNE
jgi:signal transduction histidine kinase